MFLVFNFIIGLADLRKKSQKYNFFSSFYYSFMILPFTAPTRHQSDRDVKETQKLCNRQHKSWEANAANSYMDYAIMLSNIYDTSVQFHVSDMNWNGLKFWARRQDSELTTKVQNKINIGQRRERKPNTQCMKICTRVDNNFTSHQLFHSWFENARCSLISIKDWWLFEMQMTFAWAFKECKHRNVKKIEVTSI